MILKENLDINNFVHQEHISGSIKYVSVTEITDGSTSLSTPIKYDDKYLYLRKGNLTVCFDYLKKTIVWKVLSEEKFRGYSYIGTYDEKAYLSSDDKLIIVNRNDGTIINEIDTEDYYGYLIGRYIIRDADNGDMFFEDANSLKVKWKHLISPGYIDQILINSNSVIAKSQEHIYTFDIETGKLLWQIEFQSWLDERFPEEMDTWRNDPNRSVHRDFPNLLLGPLIDDIQYICWCSHVTAFDALTGKELWSWRIPVNYIGVPKNQPVHKNGKLYVLSNYWEKEKNTIFCLDAKTGELIYQTEPGTFMVEAEHIKGFMAGNDYIVAGGEKLVVYNVEKRAISWEYEDKTPVFNGYVLPYKNGLIVAWREVNKLFWYDSELKH